MLIKKYLRSTRKIIISVRFFSKLIGRFWWLIPNFLRTRLPVNSIGYGFISPLKIFRWNLDPRDAISQKYFGYRFRKYENITQRVLLKEILNIGKSKKVHFINVGANTGVYALLVMKRFPKTKVSLFEPVPLNLQFLRNNMALNNLTPEIYDMAAGASNEIMQIYPSKKFFGLASFIPNSNSPMDVKVVRMDQVINNEVDVVLIDVEGHELAVLKGMDKILRNYGPTIIVESNSETIVELSMFLETFGYGKPVWLGIKEMFGAQEKNFLFKIT